MKLLILMSHRLTTEQEQDLRENWGITQIVYLPQELQMAWSNVPPANDMSFKTGMIKYSHPFIDWIRKEKIANEELYLLVAGDYGITYRIVSYFYENGYKSIYATTIRNSSQNPDGSWTKPTFVHGGFREYNT